MTGKKILREFDQTWSSLLEKLSAFDEAEFNRKPAEDKWSAGQVARHLIKANSGLSEMLSGATKPTTRLPDEKVEQIKSDFLNFEAKMDAPDFIVPEDENFEKDKSLETLRRIKSNINETVENFDLAKTSLAFEFPVYGYLTGLEIIAFAVYHTQRHNHQLDKISSRIK